ncbi:cyclophilin-like fold protein [uncultured Sutterella sp.]|uniref:cyclophilin-like fold protein n=1 Tax=uncultured Sutterella sp. TaxID=286133 RepID=UPI002629D151|nr:cyclophilin-like fold protein [uncultured Sutterella sp.]
MSAEIQMTVGGQTFPVMLEENDAAKDLMKRLPLSLVFENYGSLERISYLKEKLELGNAPRSTTPAAGDLTYYAPWNNLAVFKGSFRTSPGLVPLGKLSPEALKAIVNSEDQIIRFENK